MKKIVTYNVNGIRSALSKELTTWLAAEQPDIVGFQEVKANKEQVDMAEIEALGYQHYWFSAEKKGYSGTAILTKQTPDFVQSGMGHPLFDSEGRVLRADFGDLTILCCYFPSGTSGDIRQTVKYEFLDAFLNFAEKLKAERPKLLIMGDYNIAHTASDIHDPKGNKDSSGFLPEERAWMDKFLGMGYTDSWRVMHPSEQKYSWWSFRSGARGNNKGWRIDYIALSEALAPHLRSAEIHNEAVHSDHCPCSVILDI